VSVGGGNLLSKKRRREGRQEVRCKLFDDESEGGTKIEKINRKGGMRTAARPQEGAYIAGHSA